MSFRRRVSISLFFVFTLAVNFVTAQTGRRGQRPDAATTMSEGRAVWVTRFAYKTADDVRKIMENCAEMNFNTVLFQVRGNGTVYYKSEIEPWAYELTSDSPDTTGKDPGWDPLQVAIDEAHKRGLKIHAWMNVFPGWRGQKYPPADAQQLWTEHPEWFMVRKNGEKMIARDVAVDPKFPTWYTFINPAHPEVQEYVTKVFLEVVKKYDVDGINYDYVRYPSEIEDFSYDEVSLRRFKDETGGTPDEKPKEWIEWRSDQVTKIVRTIYKEAKKIKPEIAVSGAVIANFPRARDKYFARSQDWLKEGILDIAMPMNYTHGTDFTTQTENFVRNKGKGQVWMGMSGSGAPAGGGRGSRETTGTRGRRDSRGTRGTAASGDRATTETTPDTAISDARSTGSRPVMFEEIDVVRRAGAEGVAIFSYNSLVRDDELNDLGRRLKEGPFRRPAEAPALGIQKSTSGQRGQQGTRRQRTR